LIKSLIVATISMQGQEQENQEQENILVIDDKPDNLRLLSNILARENYKVRKVLSGRLAIDAAQIDPPDLILLDIMMPILNGYQVCEAFKAHPKTCDIPVIFLSALDAVEDKVKAFAVGGVDFITKPFQQQEVLARVKIHLQICRLNRALQAQNKQLQQEIAQRQAIAAELQATLQELQATQTQIILKEKLASLGAMMAGIAHELRNPLNFVNNYAESSVELLTDSLADLTQLQSVLPMLQAQELQRQELQSQELQSQEPQSQASSHQLAENLRTDLIDVRDNAIAIYQHGQRAERIIGNMMQQIRTAPHERQTANLNQVIQNAIELAYQAKQTQFPSFQATIQTNYDPAIALMNLSVADLSRAFINLIDNACYAIHQKALQLAAPFPSADPQNQASFTHPPNCSAEASTPSSIHPSTHSSLWHPTIWITTRKCPDCQPPCIEVILRDNGCGIEPEALSQIFDPFFTTKAQEGTGLGLSITHDIIVGQHHGSLVVRSKLMVYTEFMLTLPI
jgi:two-component system, NtrC family, sensor kinase